MGTNIDSDELWKRVGLEQLRRTLVRVQDLVKHFKQALHTLPPCNSCARVALLEQISMTGRKLSGEVTSLSVLAATLKQAVAIAEHTQIELTADALKPCECTGGQCLCHDELTVGTG